jgi:hypothetical protein
MAGGIWFLRSWFDLLTFVFPNIGFLEATRVVAFKTLGFQAALGLTYRITLRLEQVFWTEIGLLLYVTPLAEKRERSVPLKKVNGYPLTDRSRWR